MTRLARCTQWLTIAAFTIVGLAAALGNELRVQDVDPQYARTIVERTIRYGGTFYQNSIHNKGPLEPLVYLVASWFTTYDGYWYAISIFVAIAALLLAFAAARTAIGWGANRPLAVAAGTALFVHLTLSGADYAGVLYARNMIACLLVAAWVLTIEDRVWDGGRRRQSFVAALTGVVLGLAVQTIITTALTAGVLLVVAIAMQWERVAADEDRRRLALTTITAAAATFLSAPLYYLVRGSWTEFWSSWWVQARYMSVGTGRSLGNQLGLGAHQFGLYYQRRPLAFAVILAFALFTAAGWRDSDSRWRVLNGGLVAWFVAAWLELALSQRYSSHYFIVSTTPTALMAAALAGRGYRAIAASRPRPLPAAFAWPLAALLLTVYLSGPAPALDAIRAASGFTSAKATELDRERNLGADERTALAVLDLVSHRGDPLLTWSNEAWPYLKYHRVPASRFIWKSFLMGEIYLGRTSPQYVLRGSWSWFAKDIARTHPTAFIETNPREKGTPFDALITHQFAPVLSSPHQTIYLRDDVARDVLGTDQSAAVQSLSAGAAIGDVPLTTRSCVRVSGLVTGSARFEFTDNTGHTEHLHLALNGDHVTSGSDVVDYLSLPSGVTATPVPFSLVIGRRAAVLVIDGRIRGALRLPPSVSVRVTGAGNPIELSDLRTGAAPRGSGCSSVPS